jgi:transposase
VAASRAVIRSRLQTAVDILNQARLRSRPMYRSLRPRYPEEFRREALELVRTSGRSIADVARSLGITDSTLHIWLKAERDAKRRAEDPDGLSESERDELARLRKENIELRTDREILRKVSSAISTIRSSAARRS